MPTIGQELSVRCEHQGHFTMIKAVDHKATAGKEAEGVRFGTANF